MSATNVRFLIGAALSMMLFTGCDGDPQPPYLNKFLVKVSPKGTYEATFYNYGKGGKSGFLGATVTTPQYVNVRRRGEPFDPEQGQVLVVRHCYRLRLVWQDEQHLRIDYMTGGTVDRKQERLGDISVRCRQVSTSELPEPYKALPETPSNPQLGTVKP